jgi:hypothetical protein
MGSIFFTTNTCLRSENSKTRSEIAGRTSPAVSYRNGITEGLRHVSGYATLLSLAIKIINRVIKQEPIKIVEQV